MARSKWKYVSFPRTVWKKIRIRVLRNWHINLEKFYKRGSSIPECFLNRFINIHKGNLFSKYFLILYSKGYKFGEFSFTRKPYHFPKKKNRK